MDDLPTCLQRVRDGDHAAFASVVERFQDMAVGYAYSILGDFHLAEDAAQNAFLTAFLNLESIREPEAFAGWMKRIVFTQCSRMRRRRSHPTTDLDAAPDQPSAEPTPDERMESRRRDEVVERMVGTLPDGQREAVALHYVAGMSLREIGRFLDVPASTVKKRLHDARQRLKRDIVHMTEDSFQGHRPSRDERFSTETVAVIATAVESIFKGNPGRLRALLEAHPHIVEVGGALDFRYRSETYFGGATLLHYVAGHPTPMNTFPDNVLDLMTVLLDAGADPDATTAVGSTTLSLVGGYTVPGDDGIQIQMIDLLVSRGADPNGGFGVSPLEEALRHGETESARAIHRHGGNTDMRLAAGLGLLEQVEEYCNPDGSLADGAAAQLPPLRDGTVHVLTDKQVLSEALSLAVLNWQFDMVDLLLPKGAGINAHDIHCHGGHHTPLHHACNAIPATRGNTSPKMVAYLLDRGADPSIRDTGDAQATPFQWAIHNGLPEIVAYMIERDAGVGRLDSHLRHALGCGNVEVMRRLLDGGADRDAVGSDGKMLIDVAREKGDEAMVALLAT